MEYQWQLKFGRNKGSNTNDWGIGDPGPIPPAASEPSPSHSSFLPCMPCEFLLCKLGWSNICLKRVCKEYQMEVEINLFLDRRCSYL